MPKSNSRRSRHSRDRGKRTSQSIWTLSNAREKLLSQGNNTQKDQKASFDSLNGIEEQEKSTPTSTIVDYRGRSQGAPRTGPFYDVQKHGNRQESDCESESPPESLTSHDQSSLDPDDSVSVIDGRRSYERDTRRTVQLNNLPLTTTHADIVGTIRGGPVIDIYINLKEHRAAVSFVHGQHAKNYYEFAQAFGVYIQGSQVSCSARMLPISPPTLTESRLPSHGVPASLFLHHTWRNR